MHNFHLSPEGSGWKLTSEESLITVQNFDNKEEAIRVSAGFLRGHGGSLRIHGADGRFEEERTYPRAADPGDTPG